MERMLQRGAGDSWEHRRSWFGEWSAHVTGTLKCAPLSGRVISPERESDKRLVRQTDVCLFTAETESQLNYSKIQEAMNS